MHFTELDVDVLPQVWNLPVAEISTRFEYKPERDPFKAGLTQEMNDKLSSRYEELFKLFIKHKDKIDRVTLWGVSDDASWLNDFPIRGRTAYPRCLTAATSPRTRTAGCWRCRAAGSASGRRNGHDLGRHVARRVGAATGKGGAAKWPEASAVSVIGRCHRPVSARTRSSHSVRRAGSSQVWSRGAGLEVSERESRAGVRARKDQPSSPSANAPGMLRGCRSCGTGTRSLVARSWTARSRAGAASGRPTRAERRPDVGTASRPFRRRRQVVGGGAVHVAGFAPDSTEPYIMARAK